MFTKDPGLKLNNTITIGLNISLFFISTINYIAVLHFIRKCSILKYLLALAIWSYPSTDDLLSGTFLVDTERNELLLKRPWSAHSTSTALCAL